MTVLEFLDKFLADYEVAEHDPVFLGQEIAAERHLPGVEAAKGVVVKADGRYYMCALPAYREVDLDLLKEQLRVEEIEIADDLSAKEMLSGCEPGTEAPFGSLYGCMTLMDKRLDMDEYIAFEGETYSRVIWMSVPEYKRLASPRMLNFSCVRR